MKSLPVLAKLRKVTRFINLENKRIEKQLGVSLPQLLCLHWLSTQPGHRASSKAIKDYLQLNASTVTGIVQRLEKRCLLSRHPDSQDLRGNQIVLTKAGLGLIETFAASSESTVGRLSPSQIMQLEATIDLLIAELDSDNDPSDPVDDGVYPM